MALFLVVAVVVVVVVFVVVIFVSNENFVNPVHEFAHSREHRWMSSAGASASSPAGDSLQRPVGGIAAEAHQRTTRVALTGAPAAARVAGAQHRRMDTVVVPRTLVAQSVRVVVHVHLVQAFQRSTVRCTN